MSVDMGVKSSFSMLEFVMKADEELTDSYALKTSTSASSRVNIFDL